MSGVIEANGAAVRFSRTESKLIDALFRRPDGYPDAQALADAMYVNGFAPAAPAAAAQVYAVKLRTMLATVGLTITRSYGIPRCGYQLVQINSEAVA